MIPRTVNQGDFGQRCDFGQFLNISVLSLYKEFLDEIFFLWSSVTNLYHCLWHDYPILKFFVQRQYRGVQKLSKVIQLFKVTPSVMVRTTCTSIGFRCRSSVKSSILHSGLNYLACVWVFNLQRFMFWNVWISNEWSIFQPIIIHGEKKLQICVLFSSNVIYCFIKWW